MRSFEGRLGKIKVVVSLDCAEKKRGRNIFPELQEKRFMSTEEIEHECVRVGGMVVLTKMMRM